MDKGKERFKVHKIGQSMEEEAKKEYQRLKKKAEEKPLPELLEHKGRKENEAPE
ncbi:hypothetical protein MYX75_09030 [Acidobacteria bacterium AH-259-A15]|nr:hypothetical protein [Acidobacteria bacterium AH-259-A15]